MPRGTLSPITWPDGRPSEVIKDVIKGKKELKDQTLAIQSACSFYIYLAACDILEFTTKEERRQALATLPDRIRPYVQAEAEKLCRYRHVNTLRRSDHLRMAHNSNDNHSDIP